MAIELTIVVDNQPRRDLSEGLVEARVEQQLDGPWRYTLRYEVDIVDGAFPMLEAEEFRPGRDLALVVGQNTGPACLVQGPIDRIQVHYQHGGPGSWLEISGGDRCVEMDRVHQTRVWAGYDSEIVHTLAERYGLQPNVSRTEHEHSDGSHTQNQSATDKAWVCRLARRNGFRFWISYEVRTRPFLIREVANFRPSPPRDEFPASAARSGVNASAADALAADGPPRLAINVNRSGQETMSSFDVEVDIERPTAIAGIRVGESTAEDRLTEVPVSPQDLLGEVGLAEFAGPPARTMFLATAGEPGEFSTRAKAALVEAGWFIQAKTETTKDLLGGALVEPHMILPVEGLGAIYSGDYFVTAVTHTIDHVNHRMELSLVRNATGPLP